MRFVRTLVRIDKHGTPKRIAAITEQREKKDHRSGPRTNHSKQLRIPRCRGLTDVIVKVLFPSTPTLLSILLSSPKYLPNTYTIYTRDLVHLHFVTCICIGLINNPPFDLITVYPTSYTDYRYHFIFSSHFLLSLLLQFFYRLQTKFYRMHFGAGKTDRYVTRITELASWLKTSNSSLWWPRQYVVQVVFRLRYADAGKEHTYVEACAYATRVLPSYGERCSKCGSI